MTWEIVGQDRAIDALRRAAQDESRLAHAYLFAGPEHVGRATAARRFAQALNCTGEDDASRSPSRRRGFPASPSAGVVPGDAEPGKARLPAAGASEPARARPCGECRTCRLIGEDKHPDVEWVLVGGVCEESDHRDHGADGSRDIRICQVRRLERVVSRTTMSARHRVVIVDPAEAMTVEAANAFLKTLEEPPAGVVFVLITSHEERLPETVRSRCRRIEFSGVPRRRIEEALHQRWSASPEQAASLARLAQGRLGWAVAALQDERLLAERDRAIDDLEALLEGGLSERFATAASLGARYLRDADAVRSELETWRGWWRDVLLAAAGQEELAAEGERLDILRSNAAQYGMQGALRALTALKAGSRHLEEHASPTLALEVMLLDLPVAKGRAGP